MTLTKEEKLQHEFFLFKKEKEQFLESLNKKLSELETKKDDLRKQIKSLAAQIEPLEKEKTAKGWKIICLNIITFGIFKYFRNKEIDKKIRELENKSKKLEEEVTKNDKTEYIFKDQKLQVITEKNSILTKLLNYNQEKIINHQTKIQQEISQNLAAILVNTNHIKSSISLTTTSSGYSSDDDLHYVNDENNKNDISSIHVINKEENEKLKTELETSNQENEKLKTELETSNQENEDNDDIEVSEWKDSSSAILNSIDVVKKQLQRITDNIDGIEVIPESEELENVNEENEDNDDIEVSEWKDSSSAILNSIDVVKKQLQRITDNIDGIEVIAESEELKNLNQEIQKLKTELKNANQKNEKLKTELENVPHLILYFLVKENNNTELKGGSLEEFNSSNIIGKQWQKIPDNSFGNMFNISDINKKIMMITLNN